MRQLFEENLNELNIFKFFNCCTTEDFSKTWNGLFMPAVWFLAKQKLYHKHSGIWLEILN